MYVYLQSTPSLISDQSLISRDPPSRRRSYGLFLLGILPDPHRPTTTDPSLHLSSSVLKPHGARPLPVAFDHRRRLLLVAFEETNASLASKLDRAPLLLPPACARGACLGCRRKQQQPSEIPAPVPLSSLDVPSRSSSASFLSLFLLLHCRFSLPPSRYALCLSTQDAAAMASNRAALDLLRPPNHQIYFVVPRRPLLRSRRETPAPSPAPSRRRCPCFLPLHRCCLLHPQA